jgi:hypothetical protein
MLYAHTPPNTHHPTHTTQHTHTHTGDQLQPVLEVRRARADEYVSGDQQRQEGEEAVQGRGQEAIKYIKPSK